MLSKKKTAGQVFHLLTSPLLTLKGSSSWLVDLWSNSTTLSLSLSTPPPPQIGRSSPGAAKAKEARRRKENSQNQKTRILCFVSKASVVVVQAPCLLESQTCWQSPGVHHTKPTQNWFHRSLPLVQFSFLLGFV